MEEDLRDILMEILTMVSSEWEKLMGRVFILGKMGKFMMENGILV